MDGSSRNASLAADDLDSTVLRHQVQRYFNDLRQESETPLNMDFLAIKRKPQSSARQSTAPKGFSDSGFLPKKFCFDTTADGSLKDSFSLHHKPQHVQDSFTSKSVKPDITSQLERKLSVKEAEIIQLQEKIIRIEMKLNESETARNCLASEVEKVREVSQAQVKQCEDKVEDLQIEADRLKVENDTLRKESTAVRECVDKWRLIRSEEKLSYSRELEAAEEKARVLRSEFEAEIAKLRADLEASELEVQRLKLDAEEARNLLQLKEKQVIKTCDHDVIIEQQRQVIREMENALFTQRTSFSQSQEAKLAKIPQMEKEIAQLQQTNRLLRETAANELLLKEQINSLQSSLNRYKEQCQTIPQLEGEVNKLKSHLAEWEQLAQRLFDADSLFQVRIHVDEMRRRELKLTEDLGNLQAEINSLKRLNETLKEQLDSFKEGSRTRLELEERVRKLERKLVVVQKDREHYRTMNEQFERDMTHIGAAALLESKEAQQIRQLERLLDEYRDLVGVGASSTSLDSFKAEATRLTEERDSLAKQVTELTGLVETLKIQLQQAGNSAETRVLHFKSNPLDNARLKTLEQLAHVEKENESLRERIRLMESGQTQNLTILVGEHFEQGFTPERLKELEEKLKSSELKFQRTEEVFQKYCSDFRRGIFELFGYQVDNDGCGNFKLTSVFSESSSDYLSFKYVGDGLMVMDSPFLHTLDDLVQLHVTNQKSIPIFLSALQVELFSRQSINSSVYPSTLNTPS